MLVVHKPQRLTLLAGRRKVKQQCACTCVLQPMISLVFE